MKWQTISAAAALSVLVTSVGLAQCNRGGSSPSAGNSSAGIYNPQLTQTGFANPYSNSAFARRVPQSPSALQTQRALFAQQMYRQALARQQGRNVSQRDTRSRSDSLSSTSDIARNRPTARQQRLRQQNAERAFALASKAEANGKSTSAEKYYRRAIRIAGSQSDLAERAESALAALSSGTAPTEDDDIDLNVQTILASLEPK